VAAPSTALAPEIPWDVLKIVPDNRGRGFKPASGALTAGATAVAATPDAGFGSTVFVYDPAANLLGMRGTRVGEERWTVRSIDWGAVVDMCWVDGWMFLMSSTGVKRIPVSEDGFIGGQLSSNLFTTRLALSSITDAHYRFNDSDGPLTGFAYQQGSVIHYRSLDNKTDLRSHSLNSANAHPGQLLTVVVDRTADGRRNARMVGCTDTNDNIIYVYDPWAAGAGTQWGRLYGTITGVTGSAVSATMLGSASGGGAQRALFLAAKNSQLTVSEVTLPSMSAVPATLPHVFGGVGVQDVWSDPDLDARLASMLQSSKQTTLSVVSAAGYSREMRAAPNVQVQCYTAAVTAATNNPVLYAFFPAQ